jgi:chromosome partitioning protein
MKAKIITFSNQKGGVGKTTITRLVGIHLAGTGRKTLLIDTDPQGNLTKSLVEVGDVFAVPGLFEALTGADYDVAEIIPNLFLLTGDIRLANLEKSLIGEMDAYV